MKTIRISDVRNYEGKEVEIRGWLYNRRSSGKIKFLIVRDGTSFIQATLIKNEMDEKIFDKADNINYESSVKIIGIVREEKRAPLGYEVLVKNIEVVSMASDNYPISLKEHGVGYLMDYRHLWLRSPRQNAILKIRARYTVIVGEEELSKNMVILRNMQTKEQKEVQIDNLIDELSS